MLGGPKAFARDARSHDPGELRLEHFVERRRCGAALQDGAEGDLAVRADDERGGSQEARLRSFDLEPGLHFAPVDMGLPPVGRAGDLRELERHHQLAPRLAVDVGHAAGQLLMRLEQVVAAVPLPTPRLGVAVELRAGSCRDRR